MSDGTWTGDLWSGSYVEDGYGFQSLGPVKIEKAIWRQHRDGEHCDWCYIISVHGEELLTVHEDGVEQAQGPLLDQIKQLTKERDDWQNRACEFANEREDMRRRNAILVEQHRTLQAQLIDARKRLDDADDLRYDHAGGNPCLDAWLECPCNMPCCMGEVYELNITHNLGKMADEAGLYYAMWRPDEKGWRKAEDIIPALEDGVSRLKADPERFRVFNPANGWGDYEGLLGVAEAYLEACREYPHAYIGISR